MEELGEKGRNVNNWHWTEKDVLGWSKSRIDELIGNQEILNANGIIVKSKKPTVAGEAFLTNRKGKLISSYELQIKLPFDVTAADGSKGEGLVEVPYLAEENYGEKPEARVVYDPDRGTEHAIYHHGL